MQLYLIIYLGKSIMKKFTVSILAVAISLTGCATSSKDIASTYVSPLQYQNYDCAQLGLEAQRIQTRVVETGGRLDQASANDKALMGVGLVLFWPALFALGGTKNQEAEFGRLKGEYDAVQKTAIDKKCSNTSLTDKSLAAAVTTSGDQSVNTTSIVAVPAAAASAPK
jgi:hypothetical protein